MKVKVNNREKIVPVDCTAQMLVEIMGVKENEPIALALGEEVLPKIQWENTVLKEGDKLTIIRATCGG
ncbi:MAG: sulfur carrier protein ThiS [Bacteroidales bacterium]|nr:sulfur carrier protein ThiS [Bacteroidales bacterium]MBQ9312059.1 sulfur carrier protein ThiS [Bacteroidales bacterium]